MIHKEENENCLDHLEHVHDDDFVIILVKYEINDVVNLSQLKELIIRINQCINELIA